jgi:hypothetical protein
VLAHFFPDEPWVKLRATRSLSALDELWTNPPRYFVRSSRERRTRVAFANYGVAFDLHAASAWGDRIAALNVYFRDLRFGRRL